MFKSSADLQTRDDHIMISDIDTVTARLCDAFLKVRQLRELTLDQAAVALDITPRELRAIESGSLHPEPEMIKRMAEHYRIDHERLGTGVMIERSEPAIDPAACIIWFGWLPIEYGSNHASNREILDAVANGVRLLRSADPTASVQMRSAELDLVMTLLDLDDDDLVVDAVRALRIPWKRTEHLINDSCERVRSKSLVSQDRHLLSLHTDDDQPPDEHDETTEVAGSSLR